MSNSTTEVMQAAAAKPFSPLPGILQRKCACGNHTMAGGECTQCSKNRQTLQRATRDSELGAQNFAGVPSIVNEVLRSPGQPLDAQTRAFMEPRFGQDFSHVRVHTDARANESARAVNALAYTVGSHVAVRSDKHEPSTAAGRRLLAHELAHVVQQSAGTGGGDPESRANVAARRIMGGQQVNPASVGSAPVGLHRQHDDDPAGDDELIKLIRSQFGSSQQRKGSFPPIPPSSPLHHRSRVPGLLTPPLEPNEQISMLNKERSRKLNPSLLPMHPDNLESGNVELSAGFNRLDPDAEKKQFAQKSNEQQGMTGKSATQTDVMLDQLKEGAIRTLEHWVSEKFPEVDQRLKHWKKSLFHKISSMFHHKTGKGHAVW